ncbi:hypothetical protein ACT7DO_08295 [Bacillus pacificus]
MDGTNESPAYIMMDEGMKANMLREYLLLILAMRLIKQEDLIIVQCDWLLAKESCDKSKNDWYCFLDLQDSNLEKGIRKIEGILESSSLEENLNINLKNVSIILDNYRDRKFKQKCKHEYLAKIRKTAFAEEWMDLPSLNEVPIWLSLIPGKELKDGLFESLDNEDFVNTIENLNELWIELEG